MPSLVNNFTQSSEDIKSDDRFSSQLIIWQQQHGRRHLPWQNTRDAYRIWLSEIMLQQTQVATVIPYFERFIARFPDINALAKANLDEVMTLWSGLGYYARARNLHRCAQQVTAEHQGQFPADPAHLAQLPGIGRSTAAAIAVFATGRRAAILDGNVKRVLCRSFGIDSDPTKKAVEHALWQQAEALLPHQHLEAYTQGLMDLGATVCTRHRPACIQCPLAARCVALATDRVDSLPMRKPKKKIPQKRVAMLVIVDHGQILLQQRATHGIWGGLWSLPEVTLSGTDEESAIIKQAAAVFGIINIQPLPPIMHAFTHFRLQISPWLVHLKRRHALDESEAYFWHDVELLTQAPLPAPIRKLLLTL